jgi:hypothetical protein
MLEIKEDPVVYVIPWVIQGCGEISVEITQSGRLFVNGEPVEPIEETRLFFRAQRSEIEQENSGD